MDVNVELCVLLVDHRILNVSVYPEGEGIIYPRSHLGAVFKIEGFI